MATEIDPATRLLKVVKDYRAACERLRRATIADAWAAVFGCEKTMTGLIYENLGWLLELVDEVDDTIQSKPELNPDLYLIDFDRLRTGLMPRKLDTPLSASPCPFDRGLEARLEFCSLQMLKETVLEPATIKDIRNSIDELYESLKAADLTAYLRTALMAVVSTMRRALDEYEIRGLKALKQSFGLMLIEVAAHHREIKAKPDGPWKTAIAVVAGKFKSAIETGSNMATLIEFVPFASELLK